MPTEHHVKASSFADPADVQAFRHCKAKGNSDKQCFRVGDNGIGFWSDDTSEGSGPSCALPPEDIIDHLGNMAHGRFARVQVAANGHEIICLLKDTMPHRANIKNGAGIDLNPDAVKALGLKPPIMVPAVWTWVSIMVASVIALSVSGCGGFWEGVRQSDTATYNRAPSQAAPR